MSYPTPFEVQLLSLALGHLEGPEARRDSAGKRWVLAAAASTLGDLPLFELLDLMEEKIPSNRLSWVNSTAREVIGAIRSTPIPPPLAISALLRPSAPALRRKQSGAYFTDFRLSSFLMTRLAAKLEAGARVFDPAMGSGAFLVAFLLAASKAWSKSPSFITENCIFGADLAHRAISDTICAVAATGASTRSLRKLRQHLFVCDSLQDEVLSSYRFDAAVGNPPWEKLKLTRHEY